jgi:predicted transcriptional regulator
VISSKKEPETVAKNKSGTGDLGALTMRQTDRLARRLARGADRLDADRAASFDAKMAIFDTAMDIHDVCSDLHDSWMARHARGER